MGMFHWYIYVGRNYLSGDQDSVPYFCFEDSKLSTVYLKLTSVAYGINDCNFSPICAYKLDIYIIHIES